MEKNVPFKFDASFTNALQPTKDPELYEGKVRVFYKHLNRNGSYITDSFANKFAETAYMKPVIGSYSHSNLDFQGHEGPTKAKAYGVVIPGSLEWEDHEDDDGEVRTYATYSTIIWAEYWEEAKQIFTKTQSMELDPKTIQGDWQVIDDDGNKAFVYTEGVISGLCVLGDTRTPCFEGAAFFSTEDDGYRKFSLAIQKYFEQGGRNEMNIEENQVPETVTEMEEAQLVEETVEQVVETAESVAATEQFEEESTVEQAEEIPAESVNEEVVVVDYEAKYNELLEKFNSVTEENSNLQNNLSAKDVEFETLQQEMNNLRAEFESLNEAKTALNDTYEALKSEFNTQAEVLVSKDSIIEKQNATIAEYEVAEKDRIIEKFSKCLPQDTVQSIMDKKNEYSIDQLKTQCAVEYTQYSMAKEQNEEVRIPHPQQEQQSALYKILINYKK